MEYKEKSPFRVRIWAHAVGWMIFFFAPVILSPGRDMIIYFSESGIFISLVVRNILLMVLFYANLFYFTPSYFNQGNYRKFFFAIVILIFLVGTANYFIHEFVNPDMFRKPLGPGDDFARRPPPDFDPGPPPRRLMLASPYFSSLLITALVAAASTLLVLWNHWTQAKASEQERTLQKVAAELSVLKLQVSPHFLFNTLNNIRWLVRSHSENAEPALVKLSQLLRYILYQASQEKVTLQQEIEHLQDYIALQKMRFPENETIQLTIKGEMSNKRIVPLLLIPIVENFFKHGDFSKPSGSKMELTVLSDQVSLSTVNRILVQHQSETKDGQESAIGIDNVKKRLNLHYPGLHDLQYYARGDNYFVNLTIVLS